ncbi:MAG: hypothetical protein ACFCVH_03820 [Alphaproteobacteria bacterium]
MTRHVRAGVAIADGSRRPTGRSRRRVLGLLLLPALGGLAGVLAWWLATLGVATAPRAGAAPNGFAIHPEPRAMPELAFEDGDSNPQRVADLPARWCY